MNKEISLFTFSHEKTEIPKHSQLFKRILFELTCWKFKPKKEGENIMREKY